MEKIRSSILSFNKQKGAVFFSSVLSVRKVLNFELLALVLEKVLQIIRGKEQKREKIETILQAL